MSQVCVTAATVNKGLSVFCIVKYVFLYQNVPNLAAVFRWWSLGGKGKQRS